VRHVVEELVEDALRELADDQCQRELWTASEGPEVSSLVECVSRLWDDSGLADALDGAEVLYTHEIDSELVRLQLLLSRIDDSGSPNEILGNPRLGGVRQAASGLLNSLRQLANDRAG